VISAIASSHNRTKTVENPLICDWNAKMQRSVIETAVILNRRNPDAAGMPPPMHGFVTECDVGARLEGGNNQAHQATGNKP
jgi:hypothetical protein